MTRANTRGFVRLDDWNITSCQSLRMAMRGLWKALATLSILLTTQGCSATRANLTLASTDGSYYLSQSFTNCYATSTPLGDWDVVLVNDPATLASAPAGGPLQPSHIDPRQIVHLRVLWKPPSGTAGDQVAASNASVEWFLVGDDESSEDLVEYSGTAFVSLDQSGTDSKLVIRSANLRPVVCRGHMRDRLGPSKLTGSVVAIEDGSQVHQVLDEEKRLLQPGDISAGPGGHPVSAAIRSNVTIVP